MNIINAIINLVNNPIVQVTTTYKNKNRANNAGDALEEYVKDLFANTFDTPDEERHIKHSEVFSYLGNSNNPPDAMLRDGDAVETKKLESNSAIALNSSYPKHTLKSTNDKISKNCREAEEWTEKDIIYIVGMVNNGKLKNLCMVYGLDYCASEECYDTLINQIKSGVLSIPDVDFTESNEIAHVNKVDPLGITYMRVRGMWGIENPWKVFNYVCKYDKKNDFQFMSIINKNKWNSFDNTNELEDLAEKNDALTISDVKIKNPDNPANLIDAKLIQFIMRG